MQRMPGSRLCDRVLFRAPLQNLARPSGPFFRALKAKHALRPDSGGIRFGMVAVALATQDARHSTPMVFPAPPLIAPRPNQSISVGNKICDFLLTHYSRWARDRTSFCVPGRPQQKQRTECQSDIGNQCSPGKICNEFIVNPENLPAPQIFPESNLHFPILWVERSQLPVGWISKLGEFTRMPVAEQPEKQASKQPTAGHCQQNDHYRHSGHGLDAKRGY